MICSLFVKYVPDYFGKAMKILLLSITLFLSISSCSQESASSGTSSSETPVAEVAAIEAPLVFPGLAERLPDNTTAFFSITDFDKIRTVGQSGFLGRTWSQSKMQRFFAEATVANQEAWMEIQDQLSSEGLGKEFLKWSTYDLISGGYAHGERPFFIVEFVLHSEKSAQQLFEYFSKMEARGEFGDDFHVALNGSALHFSRGEMVETGASLTSLESFRADWRINQNASAPVMVWLNVLEAASQQQPGLDPAIVGLSSLHAFSGWSESGASTAEFSMRFLKAAKPEWVDYFGVANPDLLKYIPSNAETAIVGNFQVAKLFRDHFLENETELEGIDLETLFSGLGSNYWGWSRSKGMTPTGFLAFEVSNFETVNPEFEKMMRYVLAHPSNIDKVSAMPLIRAKRLKLRVKDENGKMVDRAGPAYFSYIGLSDSIPQMGGMKITLEPTIALHPDGWFLLGWDVAGVKKALREKIKPLNRNILSHDDAEDFFASIPKGANLALWENWQPQFKQLLGLAQMGMGVLTATAKNAGGAGGFGDDLPFDLANIPNLQILVAEMRPAHTTVVVEPTRLRVRYESNFALADIPFFAGFLIGAAPLGIQIVEDSTGQTIPIFSSKSSELEF